MEEIREEKIAEILSWLQATARGKMARQTFQKLKAQKVILLLENMDCLKLELIDIAEMQTGNNIFRPAKHFIPQYLE